MCFLIHPLKADFETYTSLRGLAQNFKRHDILRLRFKEKTLSEAKLVIGEKRFLIWWVLIEKVLYEVDVAT